MWKQWKQWQTLFFGASKSLQRRKWQPTLVLLPWKNPMDGGGWLAAVHGVVKSLKGLKDFTFSFHFHALEKEMAPHSSVLAWRIPGMGEPGGLPSMGSHRVGHDWSNLAAAAAKSLQVVTAAIKLKDACSLEEKLWETYTTYLKAETSLFQQRSEAKAMVFSSSHVWMWDFDYKDTWVLKNWRFELWCWRLLRVFWTSRSFNQSILEEISPEYSLERPMLKLKLPILWLRDVKNWLIEKDPNAGKAWRREEKWMTDNEMVGWHHWLYRYEFEKTVSWWWTWKPGVL